MVALRCLWCCIEWSLDRGCVCRPLCCLPTRSLTLAKHSWRWRYWNAHEPAWLCFRVCICINQFVTLGITGRQSVQNPSRSRSKRVCVGGKWHFRWLSLRSLFIRANSTYIHTFVTYHSLQAAVEHLFLYIEKVREKKSASKKNKKLIKSWFSFEVTVYLYSVCI